MAKQIPIESAMLTDFIRSGFNEKQYERTDGLKFKFLRKPDADPGYERFAVMVWGESFGAKQRACRIWQESVKDESSHPHIIRALFDDLQDISSWNPPYDGDLAKDRDGAERGEGGAE